MTHKVCITAAGRGSRLSYARGTNKALLPIEHRSILTRIFDFFPPEMEIVLALGHESQKIRDFLELSNNPRSITFVEVDNVDGPGSGPGYSLLQCRAHLQCPFVFAACDTLVTEKIPGPEENWIGVAPVDQSDAFLVAEQKDGRVTRFFDKQNRETIADADADPQSVCQTAFIGLAGVHDYEDFWSGLEQDVNLIGGEKQVSDGLNNLIGAGITCRSFTWFDTGTDENYLRAAAALSKTTFLDKPEESLYFENNRVIKFFSDEARAAGRYTRAGHLDKAIPDSITTKPHFIAYDFVVGEHLSDVTDPAVFRKFLSFINDNFWPPETLGSEETDAFRRACLRFYKDKTLARIGAFRDKTGITDGARTINGEEVPPLDSLLDKVDWDALASGIAVKFHGDPQPENVIVTESEEFRLLDWREDFGGLTSYGDLYYDLAKIYHALIVNGEVIRNNDFSVTEDDETVTCHFLTRDHLMIFLDAFEEEIGNHGWSLLRVRLLTALVYLNIAPLHQEPYDRFLYFYGSLLLNRVFEGQWRI